MHVELHTIEDHELMKYSYAVLTCGKKHIFRGTAHHINPGEVLQSKQQIGIISTANPEYTTALLSAAKFNSVLLTRFGGKLSHLALVGNELNAKGQDVCVLMVPYADLIDEGSEIVLDLDINRLEIK